MNTSYENQFFSWSGSFNTYFSDFLFICSFHICFSFRYIPFRFNAFFSCLSDMFFQSARFCVYHLSMQKMDYHDYNLALTSYCKLLNIFSMDLHPTCFCHYTVAFNICDVGA